MLSLSVNPEKTKATAIIEGNYKKYNVAIYLDPNGSLSKYTCDCSSNSIWRGACKHVVAVLFALMDFQSNSFDMVKIGRLAKAINEKLEGQIFSEIENSLILQEPISETEPIRLEAKLIVKNHEKSLGFNIGSKRMYVIRNIGEFVSNVKNQTTAAYGKFSFRHTPGAFDPNSRRLLEFLIKEVSTINDISSSLMQNYYSYYMMRQKVKGLTLTDRNMDEFFDIYMNRDLEVEADLKNSAYMRVTDETPPTRFKVERRPDEIRLMGSPDASLSLASPKFKYILMNGKIYRMDLFKGNALETIMAALRESQTQYLPFGGQQKLRFASIVLPYLNRMGVISEIIGEADESAAPQLITKLYFDADGKNVSCRLICNYGEHEFNPLDSAKTPFPDINRDIPEEFRVNKQLNLYGFIPDKKRALFLLTGDEAIYRFLNDGLEDLKQNAEIYATDDLLNKKARPMTAKLGLRLSGNFLQVQMKNSEYSFLELMEALENLRAKKKFHRLKNGRFIDLTDENVSAVSELIESLDLSKKEVSGQMAVMPKYRSLYVDHLAEQKLEVERDSEFIKLADDFKNYKDLNFDVPDDLRTVLREYQKTGYQWLKVLAYYGFGGVLADDMGLGKTIEIISFIQSNQNKSGAKSEGNQKLNRKNLVVAPTSLLYNWENELRRFAPGLRTQVISGLPEKRKEQLSNPADVYITTYDTLKRDIENYRDFKFETVVADEAQNIKNPITQNAKAVKELKAKNRFALTGTPIENSLTELWSIFDFIMPGYLHTAHKFSKLYETPIVKYNNRERADALRKQIQPFLLRRLKSEVLSELPEKTETCLFTDLLPEQRKLYTALLLKARGDLEDPSMNFSKKRMRILADLNQLRQICCHPALFMEGYQEGSGKLNLALETIQMTLESGHRSLVFSQFTSMLAIIKHSLDAVGYSYFYLDGATPSKERIEMSERFNAGERELFLISLKAGGSGLNLIGADE
ncbi:MAG: SNF2 helicase associated domain-containing protein, partial [Clostridiales bacterium]|nr:SNF2 helicase associated domain-containing protein [Clostridiales bacterium]